MSTITLADLKAHLRITDAANDAILTRKLEAAEDHVAGYIGGPLEIDGDVPAPVREAVLQAAGWFFDGTPCDLGGLLAPYRAWRF